MPTTLLFLITEGFQFKPLEMLRFYLALIELIQVLYSQAHRSTHLYNDFKRQQRLKSRNTFVFIQINFLFFSFLPYWFLSTETQTRQITIICCYKAFQEFFDWSHKNPGLFMSPRIDLTLVRMNCRSIGLPLGRLNEQAQHRGPVVGRLPAFFPARAGRRRGGKGCNDFQFPALSDPFFVNNAQVVFLYQRWFKRSHFSPLTCICMTTTKHRWDILSCNLWLITFRVILLSMSIPHYSCSEAIVKNAFFSFFLPFLMG